MLDIGFNTFIINSEISNVCARKTSRPITSFRTIQNASFDRIIMRSDNLKISPHWQPQRKHTRNRQNCKQNRPSNSLCYKLLLISPGPALWPLFGWLHCELHASPRGVRKQVESPCLALKKKTATTKNKSQHKEENDKNACQICRCESFACTFNANWARLCSNNGCFFVSFFFFFWFKIRRWMWYNANRTWLFPLHRSRLAAGVDRFIMLLDGGGFSLAERNVAMIEPGCAGQAHLLPAKR